MKRFTLQAQLNLQEKHEGFGGGLGDLVLAGKKQRNDVEAEDPNDCCGRMMMMKPASIPAFIPYTHPEVPASPVSPVGLVGPVVGNGINKKTEVITQMKKMLCLNTQGGYYQQSYRLQSTTVTNTTGTTTTKITTELNNTTIHGFEQDDHHHPHHLHHHHHHHPNEHHHSGSTSSNSSVSSVSFYSSEDADVLSSAPTTPVNEKVQMNFPAIFTRNEEEEKAELESKSILPVTKINAITPENAITVLPSTRIPPKPTVEEITDDESNTKESLQVWHGIKEEDDGALGDDDDSEESDEEELEDETDSGEEDDDEEEDDSDEEEEVWETEDEEGHHVVQFTEVSEISMGGFVFGYSDGEEEEETDSEDDSEFDEEDEDDEEDCANDGLFGYDSADDSDDEENSDDEEEEEVDHKFPILEELPCPMRRINSHRQFDRPPLRPCLSTVSMKREDSNCSSNSGSRVRFSETAERPQIIKTTHFRYSYYEFEAHLKSSECDSELKSTFGDSRTEMEKFQEINFLRESYISLLDDDDAARERENPSNSIVGKVEHILLSKAMESRGEDCQLEDIGLGFGSKANFCTEALFALIGGKIKLSDIQKEQHAKGDQAPPCTPVVSPDASGDEWETDADGDDEE